MTQFRKKPVVIDAVQWSGDITTADKILDFANETGQVIGFRGDTLVIYTLEGPMMASPNDWIIRGIKGEIYACKPDIFEQTYERVPDEQA